MMPSIVQILMATQGQRNVHRQNGHQWVLYLLLIEPLRRLGQGRHMHSLNWHPHPIYQYSWCLGAIATSFLPSAASFSRRLFSPSHFSNHELIFARDLALPTLTVAIILTYWIERAKQVSSKKELISVSHYHLTTDTTTTQYTPMFGIGHAIQHHCRSGIAHRSQVRPVVRAALVSLDNIL